MPIGSAYKSGSQIIVLDEKGRQIFTRDAGNGPKDGLQGYTSGSVTIRIGNTLFTYNDKNQLLYNRGVSG